MSAVPPISLDRIGDDAARQITAQDRIRLTDYLAFFEFYDRKTDCGLFFVKYTRQRGKYTFTKEKTGA